MRLHYLKHVAFEGLANIDAWARAQGFTLTGTELYREEPLPRVQDLDWLVVMGGPMNIYEEDRFPWLIQEKQFIADAIEAGKIVLGICLGAQLIADVLGGRVYRNPHKEIGWHPVSLTPESRESRAFQGLPERFMAFHWHGDTFHLPPSALRTAQSEGCAIQAFESHGGRVVGLQFHLESSPESIRLLVEHCAEELVAGPYIQNAAQILRQESLGEINTTMALILNNLKTLNG